MISLLKKKNRCLQELCASSNRFLDSLTDLKFDEELNLFLKKREALFRLIQNFDRQLKSAQECQGQVDKTELTMATKESFELIRKCILADQMLFKSIENRKLDLLNELSKTDKSDQTIRKFKSRWVTDSGGRLDGTV